MTANTRQFLRYLDGYLTKNPGKFSELKAQHQRKTGRALTSRHAWRHRTCRIEPNASTFLVYLRFLAINKAIKPAKDAGDLFELSHPELLRKVA